MNRQQRRQKQRKKKNASNDHDMVRMLAKAKTVQSMAHEIESSRRAERLLWISVIAVNDAFGIGAGRIGKFIEAINDNAQKWDKMATDADDEYADEKLRQAVEQVCGQPLQYLYTDEEMMNSRRRVNV